MDGHELTRRLEQTTHGLDGALLGKDWADLSKGKLQCDWVISHGPTGLLCCALALGHADGHRDGYVGNQRPQADWRRRG